MAIHAKLSYKFELHIRVSSRSADGKGGGMRVEVEETGEWECFRLWITLLQFEYRISARSRVESRAPVVHLQSIFVPVERASERKIFGGWLDEVDRERKGFSKRAPSSRNLSACAVDIFLMGDLDGHFPI